MPLVINAGVPGHNVADCLQRLDADVLAHRPTLVTVAIGTNDAINSRNLTALADFRARYGELLRRLAGCQVLVVAPPAFHLPALLTRHRLEDYAGIPPGERLAQVRVVLAALAQEHGHPCLDLHPLVAGAGMVGEEPASWLRNTANSGVADGVHPTAAGARAIAVAVATAIAAHRLDPARTVCLGDSITNGQYLAGAGTATGETWPAWLARILGA
ncbi:MAG: SGNH/GDSL hydrolase family protein [Planctomycetes bacterium]|nr:SGNH/GDSL hydrolase family protein [Planctomycetota bacterium]